MGIRTIMSFFGVEKHCDMFTDGRNRSAGRRKATVVEGNTYAGGVGGRMLHNMAMIIVLTLTIGFADKRHGNRGIITCR